jgi:hypothetical protein
VLADIDGDADIDLVTGNRNQTNRLYINQRARRITQPDISDLRVSEAIGTASLSAPCLGSTDAAGSVEYVISSATATAGTDFTSSSGTLTWTAGNCGTAQSISTPITNDELAEGDETFTLSFSKPVGIYLNDPQSQTMHYTFTIVDNDTVSGGGNNNKGDDDSGGGGSSDALWLLALAFGLRAKRYGKARMRKTDKRHV